MQNYPAGKWLKLGTVTHPYEPALYAKQISCNHISGLPIKHQSQTLIAVRVF